ncbi:MAG: FAD-dependent oxidoreductase [Acidobacteria bacterium]|nr:FAD-dependent oxidoreductase [Acidobacteriota bacterium]
MANGNTNVVIVGGGIVGVSTAYFLGKAGVKSTIVERDSVGSHASGFAYGGLSALGGIGNPGPLSPVASDGMRIHVELSDALLEETGINTEFRYRPSLSLAFTEEEARDGEAHVSWVRGHEGYDARWLDAGEARAIEPRISDKVLGAVYTEGGADVEPYRFSLALAQAAEGLGATIRHGNVVGLRRESGRVRAVVLESGEIPCDRAVLAMGPWSGLASSWLGVPIDVRPLKGQIIRLRAPGPPLECSIGWAGDYATSKPDGLVWAGTTEEEAGFDEGTTTDARDSIMASLVKMVPALAEAQLVQQTACLRPLSADGLLVLGPVPGWEGVYVATGGARTGISLGPAMGRIAADLVTKGSSDIPIDAFNPGRFAS